MFLPVYISISFTIFFMSVSSGWEAGGDEGFLKYNDCQILTFMGTVDLVCGTVTILWSPEPSSSSWKSFCSVPSRLISLVALSIAWIKASLDTEPVFFGSIYALIASICLICTDGKIFVIAVSTFCIVALPCLSLLQELKKLSLLVPFCLNTLTSKSTVRITKDFYGLEGSSALMCFSLDKPKASRAF
jgi:hypothetical protein